MQQRRAWMRSWLPLVLILGCAAPLYFWQLGSVPAFGGDEARFAVHAYSLATTGRDTSGTTWPLMIRIEEYARWYQPFLFYLIALVLKAAPLAEWSVRLPTVVLGLADIALAWAVARRLFGRTWFASLCAVILALSPPHLIYSRQALDYLCPVFFTLAWLWCFLDVMENGRAGVAGLAGLLLGIGLYSHISGWLMMPLYLAIGIVAVVASGQKLVVPAAMAGGFGLALLPLLGWLSSHPGMFSDLIQGNHIYDASRLSPLQGAKDLLNLNSIETRLSTYWDFFNPGYLFLAGGSNMTSSTRRVGVFLLPLMIFVPCGVYYLWTRRTWPVACVLLAGLVTAPLGPSLVASPYAVQRELYVIPFGTLIAVFGVAWLWNHPVRFARALTILMLLALPVQYSYFYRDYSFDYARRSAVWFDRAGFEHIGEYVAGLSASSSPAALYLSDALDDGAVHWPYQMTKRGHLEILSKTKFFADSDLDPAKIEPGGWIVLYNNDPRIAALTSAGGCCSMVTTILDINSAPSAIILERK